MTARLTPGGKTRLLDWNILELRVEMPRQAHRMTATGIRMTADELLALPDNGMRLDLVDGELQLAPDLVVEVVSPNDSAGEVQQKTDEWLFAGVLLVWLLYPATRTAMTFRVDGAIQLLHADDTVTAEPVLPGFACRVGDLF
jgi:Uma2 family endonuclease